MTISAYYTTPDSFILRASDGEMIPTDDPTNEDYIAYQTWVAAGNTAPAYVPPTE